MIRYELLRMLRNRKWKYLIPAALLAYIYISGVSSFTVTEGSIYQDQQIQAAACLVSFLFLSIVYQIAWEEEPSLSWQVLLAFPLTCRKSYLCKLCTLLLFQLPAAAIGIGVYAVIQKTIASPFLTFLLCIHVIVMEDLAYFCMDFRRDMGHPFEPPYPPTVARYTDNYILMLSSSKIFSYAGQRMALACISDKLFDRQFPALAERYKDAGVFGPTLIASILYMITSGCTASTQYAYAEMLRLSTEGKINFVEDTREYARRAERMKKIFTDNGFHIVYDYDATQVVGDGFFFTIGYGNMTGGELLRELLYYGVSSISLSTTGSEQEGVRACTSRMRDELYPVMEERMRAFHEDH